MQYKNLFFVIGLLCVTINQTNATASEWSSNMSSAAALDELSRESGSLLVRFYKDTLKQLYISAEKIGGSVWHGELAFMSSREFMHDIGPQLDRWITEFGQEFGYFTTKKTNLALSEYDAIEEWVAARNRRSPVQIALYYSLIPTYCAYSIEIARVGLPDDPDTLKPYFQFACKDGQIVGEFRENLFVPYAQLMIERDLFDVLPEEPAPPVVLWTETARDLFAWGLGILRKALEEHQQH
jgi:hypothetical protein